MTTPVKQSKFKQTAFTFVLVIMFIAFFIASFIAFQKIKAKFSKVDSIGNKPIAVSVTTLRKGTLSKTISSLAQLDSIASIQVKAEIQGKVIKLTKREGDSVIIGEVIANIDPSESTSQLKSARAQTKAALGQVQAMEASITALKKQRLAVQANLNFQQKQMLRDKKLFKSGAISSIKLEQTRNVYADASSKLSSLDAQIKSLQSQKFALRANQDASKQSVALWKVRNAYSTVSSTVNGTISNRNVEEGDFVSPGNTLYTIENSIGNKLVFQIPQDNAIFIKLGQFVIPDGSFINTTLPKFKVTRIYPKLNHLNQMTVEAETEQLLPPLPIGIQIPVKIIIEEQTGVVIPYNSVFNKSSNECNIYLVKADQAIGQQVSVCMFDNMGNAIVSPENISLDVPVISASYLTDKRFPSSFTVELVK